MEQNKSVYEEPVAQIYVLEAAGDVITFSVGEPSDEKIGYEEYGDW